MNQPGEILKNFYVLEGLDGSGTTTQLQLLENKLKHKHIPYYSTFEPTNHPIGKMIRSVLTAREKVEHKTLSLLFAADRHEHLYHPEEGIISRTNKGQFVICDRYLFSSLAYQSGHCGFEEVLKINNTFPLPEHLFFLDVPFEICQKRMSVRNEADIFEHISLQKEILMWYEKALNHFNGTQMHIHRIDGSLSKEEINEKIWSILRL
jgi:dTMP kinase